jgi:hypothetical protein
VFSAVIERPIVVLRHVIFFQLYQGEHNLFFDEKMMMSAQLDFKVLVYTNTRKHYPDS